MRKSNVKVSPVESSLYAHWRTHGAAAFSFHEGRDAVPPERLLQAVWQNQRLLRDQLRTLDGQRLQVLHPGFKNREAGPDFRGAVLQMGGDTPQTGDVEIDLRSAGWRAHGHDRNPAFQNVILHVIWDGEKSSSVNGLVTLALREFLDAPLSELDLWLGSESAETLPENLRGRCSAPLRALTSERLTELLRQAAHVRLQSKAGWFQARARQAGWEQALWEGLFRALGYKQNVWPMQRLAELRKRWLHEEEQTAPIILQARLLGIANFLPTELARTKSGADDFVQRVWNQWWRERDEFADCILPRSLWRFGGQRPANHPQRRLALAAHWLAAGDLISRLERWCLTGVPDKALVESLMQILQIRKDDFWSWHWTMRSARLKRPQPLLGPARATDLAVNVILPWLWARASEGNNQELRALLESRFIAWPASEDNAVLLLARQRLFGGVSRRVLQSAAAQQGLIQIVRDFCDHSNAICENCHFPQLVRDFAT